LRQLKSVDIQVKRYLDYVFALYPEIEVLKISELSFYRPYEALWDASVVSSPYKFVALGIVMEIMVDDTITTKKIVVH